MDRVENINGLTEISAVPENRDFYILIDSKLSDDLLGFEDQFKNGLKKIDFNHDASENWHLYRTDGLLEDSRTKILHSSLSFLSQPKPKWVEGLRAQGRNDFHCFAKPKLFLPDNYSNNLVLLKRVKEIELNQTSNSNTFELPKDLSTDEKLDVVILSESGDQIDETLNKIS